MRKKSNAESFKKILSKKPSKKKKAEAVMEVEAAGYYLSNPKYDMKQVLMLIGRNPKFNGMLIEGKPEDFEGRENQAYYYVEQNVNVKIKDGGKDEISGI